MNCNKNTLDIEDFGIGLTDNVSNEKFKHNYDSIENQEKIKIFILNNLHIRKWDNLESNIRAFSKINKVNIKKEDLIYMYNKLELNEPDFYKIIIKKAMRAESGVLVVSLVTTATPEYTDKKTGERKKQRYSCVFDCFYCPNEPAHEGNNWVAQPRSYLEKEPSVLRANKCGFDCVKQFRTRINSYMHCGQIIMNSKIEVIVLGGTISSYPKEYVEEFCRDIYYSANTIFEDRTERYSLETEIQINETAKVRIIGLSLETRPDCITLEEIKWFRKMGVTRVQIGIQHTDNTILKIINRGHNIECAYKAIKLLKENNLKVDAHFMPLLPNATPDIDRKMLGEVLDNPNLSVDQLKIYPTSITPWTKIEKWFNEGIYKPYSDEELFKVISEFKRKVHPWIRLNRIVRDISSQYILGACNTPHLRCLLKDEFTKKGYICNCIRCREIGNKTINPNDIKLTIHKYPASDGIEYFISYTSKNEKILYGFLRLRIPSGSNEIMKELKNCSLLRELHVYSQMIPVGSKKIGSTQHLGFGKKLLKEAEKLSKRHGYYKISCCSGIGVRDYYRQSGYKLKGNEMQKNLTNYKKIFLNVSIGLGLSYIIFKFIRK
jgi:ELP3 family radical SAM enzyme/protein acetyltransferase